MPYFLVSLAMIPERSRTATMLGIDIRPLRMSAMFHMNFSSATPKYKQKKSDQLRLPRANG